MSRLKQLGKDSLVYGIGGVLSKCFTFFTIPIFTRIFNPAEYGTIEMLTVIVGFMGAIFSMGMDSAQSMYFFKEKKNGRKRQKIVISSILQWRIFWGSIIIIISTFCSPFLNNFFFNGKLSWEYFAIAFSGVLFGQIMTQSAEIMRLLYRPWGYISITLLQSFLSASLMLIFILHFDEGIRGYFFGNALASVLVGLFGWFKIREFIILKRFHYDWWKKLLKFGIPLMPTGIATYFINTSDRWFIQYYHGENELGIFSVGAKFSMLMVLGVETFRQAWWPIAMDSMHSNDGPETFRTISRIYMGLASSLAIMLALISPWLIKWITGPEFHQAWSIMAILVWQPIFYGFFLIASAGIWKLEKTYLNFYIMIFAAIIAVLLNWLIVPQWGNLGAASSTVLTYFIWISTSLIVSERLWSIKFPLFVILTQLTLGFVITKFLIHINPMNLNFSSLLVILFFSTLLAISSLSIKKWKVLISSII